MAKQEATIEVTLRNDWFDGGRLRRVSDNPHTFPATKRDLLPSSAKVKESDNKQLDLLDDKKASDKKAAEEASAEGKAKTEADNKLKL
jgi:hypothetical protein